MKETENVPILLFDGECGLCAFAVQFMLRHEKNDRLKFASLQSDVAKKIIQSTIPAYLKADSVILVQNHRTFIKSRALLQVVRYLKFPFNLLLIFKILPTSFADSLYDCVAKNRHRFFKPQCSLYNSTTSSSRFIK